MSSVFKKDILNKGYSICLDELGRWSVERAEDSFALNEVSDFYRVVSLLEMPASDVRSMLGPGFPYVNVVAVGLQCESDYWMGLALSWVDDFSVRDVLALVDDLKKISTDRAVSQKNRQLAKKKLRRLVE